MFRKISTSQLKIHLFVAIAALLAVSPVNAHPSGHAGITMSQLIEHMLVSPFHIGVITVSVIVLAIVIHNVSKQKALKAHKSK